MESPARHTIAVASGKGGVGKSTVTLNLALALARDARVGILDADLYGPDIPAMLGLTRLRDAKHWTLWSEGRKRLRPIEERGLKVMSSAFLLGERQVMPWSSMTLPFVLRQLVDDVEWGELDYLLVDLPPGTADLQVEVFRTLPLDGVLLVVGPQDVAHLDAKKSSRSSRRERPARRGENMSGSSAALRRAARRLARRRSRTLERSRIAARSSARSRHLLRRHARADLEGV